MTRTAWEPAPAARREDAVPAGNGHHEALVYGDPDDERVMVAPHLRQAHGTRPFHPAFETRVRVRAGARTRHPGAPPTPGDRSVDPSTGLVTAVRGERRSTVFVSRADDVLVQEVTAPGPVVEIDHDHHLPGAPPGLGAGREVATGRGGTLLTSRVRFPDGPLVCVGVTLVLADTGRTTITGGGGIRIEGAGRLLLLTRVRGYEDEPGAEAAGAGLRALVEALGGTASGLAAFHERLFARHAARRN